jgi:sporulation protein YlmC with PRC-barrel domain
MKRFTVMSVASILALGVASGAVAQQTQTPPRDPQAQPPRERSEARETFQKPADAMESKKIIGVRVKDAQNKNLGEIDQLLVDPQEGKVTHAVIGVGGLMGIGETHVVVPWSDVKLSRDRDNADQWVVTMDQATLDRAPRYAADRDRTPATSPRTEPGRAPADRGTTGDRR